MAFIISSIVGGAITGGANIIASQNAAKAQTQAAQLASQTQQGMFNTTQANLQPFIQAGRGGIPNLQSFINPNDPNSTFGKYQAWNDPNNPNSTFGKYQAWNDPNNSNSPLAALMKLTMPGADMSATLAQTPGYQFQMDQANRAMNNSLAARGWGGSAGAVAKGAATYATGLAQSNWQSIVQELLNTYGAGNAGMGNLFTQGNQGLGNVFTQGTSALQNFAGMGGNAAAGLGNNAVQTGGQIGGNLIGARHAQ